MQMGLTCIIETSHRTWFFSVEKMGGRMLISLLFGADY